MTPEERTAEVEAFLHFAMVEWPSIRPGVADQLARRCERCILSEKFVSLEDGVCAYCLSEERATHTSQRDDGRRGRMEQELHDILNGYSGQGQGNHDALVLFSGGKDSAYLLHRLRSRFPELRLLAVTVDNGFFSHVAMANCRRIVERVDRVDHLVFRPERRLFIKTFRHAFTHLREEGCYTTVDRMDGDLTFDIGRNLAATLAIPLLIAGLSPEQVERILGLDSFESPRSVEREQRAESAGFGLAELYSAEERGKYWWNGSRCPDDRVPRVLYPFYAWGYDEEAIREEVVSSGLLERGQDNPLMTNNYTVPLMLAVDVWNMGYSGFEPEFAELVRTGRADRAQWLAVFEALEYLCQQGRFMPRSVSDTLGRLDLSPSQVGGPASLAKND